MSAFPKATLGSVATYLRRGRTPQYAEGGAVRVLNQRCVRWHGVDLEPARFVDDATLGKWPADTFVRPGDVLVNSTGEGTIGRAAVWAFQTDGFVTDSHLTTIRANPRKLDPWWLRYWLESPEGQAFVSDSKTGATKQTELGANRLRAAAIPLPPLSEQRRVVSCIEELLTRVLEIKRLRKEANREAEAVVPSLLAATFDEVAGSYGPTSIEAVTTSSQYGTNRKCTREPIGMPILRIPNVFAGELNVDDLKHGDLSLEERAKVRLQLGDLLIVRTNGSADLVGRCAVFSLAGEYGYASYLIRFRLNAAKVLPHYLSYFLASTRGRDTIAKIRRTSAGQYNINAESIGSIEFPLPPLEVQAALVARMDGLKATAMGLIDEHVQTDTTTNHLAPAILRKAFAGDL